MTGVFLRCPNCGTTKSSSGECEACHEAQVRYYCTNHTPGQWLESPKCNQCGAVFGKASPDSSPVSSSRVEGTPTPARPVSTRVPSTKASPGLPKARPSEKASYRLPTPVRPDTDEPSETRAEGSFSRLPDLEVLLRAAARRRSPSDSTPESETLPVRQGLGCMLRLVLMVLFFILSLIAILFVAAGSFFHLVRF
jgi:hypothetical protein